MFNTQTGIIYTFLHFTVYVLHLGQKQYQKSISQSENSSGGTSLSFPKQSKLEVSHGLRTGCIIGAERVRDLRPSQSKP